MHQTNERKSRMFTSSRSSCCILRIDVNAMTCVYVFVRTCSTERLQRRLKDAMQSHTLLQASALENTPNCVILDEIDGIGMGLFLFLYYLGIAALVHYYHSIAIDV